MVKIFRPEMPNFKVVAPSPLDGRERASPDNPLPARRSAGRERLLQFIQRQDCIRMLRISGDFDRAS